MRALVTGCAGFIGSHLSEALVNKGVTVTGIDDLSKGRLENIKSLRHHCKKSFKFIKGNVRDNGLIHKLVKGSDAVFHEACSTFYDSFDDRVRDLEINAISTLHILDAATDFDKTLINASTGSVYGDAIYSPQDEKHPCFPESFYGLSKLAGDQYCRLYNRIYGTKAISLRYYAVYGTRQDYTTYVVPKFVHRAISGMPLEIHGDGLQSRTFTHVSDVVGANIFMFLKVTSDKKCFGEAYNVAHPKVTTVLELAKKIVGLCEKSVGFRFVAGRKGEQRTINPSVAKLAGLGFEAKTDLNRGLSDVVKWLTSV